METALDWGQARFPPSPFRMRHSIPPQARRYFVSGHVQGVGFRWFVERIANELGIRGYTRNLDDGRVEVYAIGLPNQLTEMNARLWLGPPRAKVAGVEQEEAPMLEYGSFRIDYA